MTVTDAVESISFARRATLIPASLPPIITTLIIRFCRPSSRTCAQSKSAGNECVLSVATQLAQMHESVPARNPLLSLDRRSSSESVPGRQEMLDRLHEADHIPSRYNRTIGL